MKQTRYYIAKESESSIEYSSAGIISPEAVSIINHSIRIRILKMLNKNPMYPSEIAKALKMHEQKVYYHIKQMANAGLIEVYEKKEIRGTIAKKYRPSNMNFAIVLENKWKDIRELITVRKDKKTEEFLYPFIKDNSFNAKIVVGSPDPHGPYKARARDGHYAVDLGLFLGKYCTNANGFSVALDVDIELRNYEGNIIAVGGPVTNLVMAKINDFLPSKFSDKKPWGITDGKGNMFSEDNIGIIAKIKNPYRQEYSIMAIAGVRFSGTKAAVVGITRFTKDILAAYSPEKDFCCIVEGFDLDGDGKIDSIEIRQQQA